MFILRRSYKNVVEIRGDIQPHIDPIKLAEILELITNGNKSLCEGESVEVHQGGNVIKLNTHFKSTVPVSKMGLTKKQPYRGFDKVKVIRPCNFGRSQWEVKSILTGDAYNIHFHKNCDWLQQYQDGKIPVVTAKDTLKIKVSYDKYVIDKKNVIKNAVVETVTVNKDPDGEQITIND